MSLPYLQPYLGLSNGLNTLHAAGGGGAAVGGWKELGRTTLGSAAVDIDVTGLSDKRYYMYLVDAEFADTNSRDARFNTGNGSFDTGSNYAERSSFNGAADGTSTSGTFTTPINSTGEAVPFFGVGYAANYSTKEKLFTNRFVHQSTAGATTAPNIKEHVWKWANTSNPLDRLRLTRTTTYQFSSGSEVVVLGYDPADDDTNGFWQELASVEWTSGDTIDTGTFAAKKYLWVQSYTLNTNSHWNKVYFNSDSGANYAYRQSEDGAAAGAITSSSNGLVPLVSQGSGSIFTQTFSNYFIINNASNEKLVIGHSTWFYSTETGAGYAPHREEVAGKWANTSNQITSIKYINAVGNNFEGGMIKVWGAN